MEEHLDLQPEGHRFDFYWEFTDFFLSEQPVSLTEKSSFSEILLIMIFMWWGLFSVDLTIVSVLLITAFRSFKEMLTTGYARRLERPWFLVIGAFFFLC